MRAALVCLLTVLACPVAALGDDWPGWLGPQADSVWREKGICQRFPAQGLRIKWRRPIAWGYSGPAVAGGRVFVTDFVRSEGKPTNNPGARDKLVGNERVLCFDAASGRQIWSQSEPRSYNLSYPKGPRCTPAIAQGKVVTLGAEGHLQCLSAANGGVLWRKDLVQEYQTRAPIWGYTAHPLIDGSHVYCVVGGKGSVAVCFDLNSGREIWRSLSAAEQGYCPPTMITVRGKKQLLIWHPSALHSLDPVTGKSIWSLPLTPSYRMSITAPRQVGDRLFVSGIGNTAVLLKLTAGEPEILWRGTTQNAVYCANSTPVIKEGVIYGSDCQLGAVRGVRLADGGRLWQSFKPTTGGKRRASHGTAFIVQHEDRFFLFSETGDLILAKMTAKGYEELSRFHVLEPTNECFGREVVWSHPAFAGKAVFARNDKEIVCVDLAARQ